MGPGIVVDVTSSNSYRVSFDDGSSRLVHANNLRLFSTCVNSIGVIYENDTQFGDIEVCSDSDSDFEQELKLVNLDHLLPEQKQEFLALLRSYNDIFKDKPGCCKTMEHEINKVENFKPKKLVPYRTFEK